MRLGATAVLLVACGMGCGTLLSLDDGAPAGGGSGADASSGPPSEGETTVQAGPKVIDDAGFDGPAVEGSVVQGSAACASSRGPSMIELMFGSNSYCIDSTEVTNEQYAVFLADSNKPPPHARCDFDTNYTPNCDGANSQGALDPVSCIDWCDAWAFCAWAGKRLCGRIGGGPNAPDTMDDPTKSQWFAACSKGGAQDFAYGPIRGPSARRARRRRRR